MAGFLWLGAGVSAPSPAMGQDGGLRELSPEESAKMHRRKDLMRNANAARSKFDAAAKAVEQAWASRTPEERGTAIREAFAPEIAAWNTRAKAVQVWPALARELEGCELRTVDDGTVSLRTRSGSVHAITSAPTPVTIEFADNSRIDFLATSTADHGVSGSIGTAHFELSGSSPDWARAEVAFTIPTPSIPDFTLTDTAKSLRVDAGPITDQVAEIARVYGVHVELQPSVAVHMPELMVLSLPLEAALTRLCLNAPSADSPVLLWEKTRFGYRVCEPSAATSPLQQLVRPLRLLAVEPGEVFMVRSPEMRAVMKVALYDFLAIPLGNGATAQALVENYDPNYDELQVNLAGESVWFATLPDLPTIIRQDFHDVSGENLGLAFSRGSRINIHFDEGIDGARFTHDLRGKKIAEALDEVCGIRGYSFRWLNRSNLLVGLEPDLRNENFISARVQTSR